ncbi:Secreted protein OS=Streptomyces microflavus OX=1919 GN=Smic_71030 PE=4 SV=1 [Streptomyces microflavus]
MVTTTSRRTRGARRAFAGALLAGLTLFTSAGAAVADDPSASASPGDEGSGPTEAGTTFRTATALQQGQAGTAQASAGDYLYWVFPADTGQRPTVKATVKLPEGEAKRSASTWQIDVYDGLRRRQACQYGHQTRKAAPDASAVELSCVLRTVRSWSEPWANDPLPGSYYVRLTVVNLPADDLGLPFEAEVRADSVDQGGAHHVDGALAEPLVPGISVTGASGTSRPAPPVSRRTAGRRAGGRPAGCGRSAAVCSPRSRPCSATR